MCGERHKYRKFNKDHMVKQLEEIIKEDFERHNRQVIQLCKKHWNQEILLFCKDCKKSGCSTYHALSHVGFSCSTIKEADNEFIESIKKSFETVEEMISI